jgi:hypothetical protein
MISGKVDPLKSFGQILYQQIGKKRVYLSYHRLSQNTPLLYLHAPLYLATLVLTYGLTHRRTTPPVAADRHRRNKLIGNMRPTKTEEGNERHIYSIL